MIQELEEEQLDELYTWVDQTTLSRPKRNISRDFADGVLFAELVSNYFPKKVEVHNYPTASSSKAKLNNWTTLNAKVLTKLGMEIPEQLIQDIVNAKPLAIEQVLIQFRNKIKTFERNAPQGTSRALEEGGGEESRAREADMSRGDQLKLIYRTLMDKINSVERSIKRKDDNIKELERIIAQHS